MKLILTIEQLLIDMLGTKEDITLSINDSDVDGLLWKRELKELRLIWHSDRPIISNIFAQSDR
ncbi:hypothetical protein [Piscirickettsia salmonis]|uniref:hypothetical protein n=1 Tax=Piscirickettsia salmonis TaxID=1238 RepID=UPI001EE23046|nr:hypothetical protein [Piscirickettsia salmonis]